MAFDGDFPIDQFEGAFSPTAHQTTTTTATNEIDTDFPVDQFADLSMFSSATTFASTETDVKGQSPQPKVKSPKVTAVASPKAGVSKEQPPPLLQKLATAVVDRLYNVAVHLRNDIEKRTIGHCLHLRSDEAAFSTIVIKHINLTVLQELYYFSDEKKAELEEVWTQYNLYKRTKAKDTMSKRQYAVLMSHWLSALASAENGSIIRAKDVEELPEPAGSKSGLFSRKPKVKTPEPLRSIREVLEEILQLCLFGASSTLVLQAEAVADASWGRMYTPDTTDFTPRGNGSGSEGSQLMFVMNFVPSLSGLKSHYEASGRPKMPALCAFYDKLLKEQLAVDTRHQYARQLARSGLI